MTIWDKNFSAPKNFDLTCGKCGGTDYYIGNQVMSQGRTNSFTKNVQVPVCKQCDVQMIRTANKRGKKLAYLILVAILVALGTIPVLIALAFAG